MLDSLVRVSRRVGGAADLLATEMRPVPVRHSLYETTQVPARTAAQAASTRTVTSDETNFAHARGTLLAVRRVKHRKNAATDQPDCAKASLRIARNAASQPLA